MKLDIHKASKELSKLDIKIQTDHMHVEVLWFRIMKMKGEWLIDRHRHSSYEFHIVAAGSCIVKYDDIEFEVTPGDVYLTPPGVYHTQTHNDSDHYLEYSLNLDMKLVNHVMSEERQLMEALSSAKLEKYRSEELIRLFNIALEEAYMKRLGFYNKIKGIINLLLVETARTITDERLHKLDHDLSNKKCDYRYTQIRRFIKDNINRPISTSEIAVHMHLSQKQVNRIVKANSMMSTKELICESKLEKSKELLKMTDYSIGQISEVMGFSSQYYFNQFFKVREKVSPSIYRKMSNNLK